MEYYETVKGLNPRQYEIYLGESDIYLSSEDAPTTIAVLEEGQAFTDGNALTVREEYIKEHTVMLVNSIYDRRDEEFEGVHVSEYE